MGIGFVSCIGRDFLGSGRVAGIIGGGIYVGCGNRGTIRDADAVLSM